MRRSRCFVWTCLALLAALCAGCPSASRSAAPAKAQGPKDGAVARGSARIQGVNLNDPIRPAADDHAIALGAAKNEWASFAVQVSGLPKGGGGKVAYSFRVQAPRMETENRTIDLENLSAEQILPMPVDVNRAGFVRHTGLSAGNRPLPRALLPVPMDRGVVNLSAVRDPANPTDPKARPTGGEPLLFWIDLRVPPQTPAGEYVTTCELLASDSPAPLASVPVKITIYDFVLPDERHLQMTSRLGWDDLKRLWPEQFETVRPQLVTRADPVYAPTVGVLDSLVRLAQRHRTEVVVPRLQPTVKWPTGRPPQIDWSDVDTVIAPWLSGDAFEDRIPLNYWPLPAVDYLDRFDRRSQLQYWTAAATHFDQKEWLNRSPVAFELSVPGRAGMAEALQMSADAAQLLKAHPKVRVTLPLEEDQVRVASKNDPDFVDPATGARLLAASPGIIFNTPIQKWPAGQPAPQKWLRTDVPGLVQYVGAGGDERDVRVWAWLAFRNGASLVQWGSPLPRTGAPSDWADPSDLVWFYPGSWFGADQPLATLQLKWLRRAQQDYEYLWLARTRGEALNAMMVARLMTKPVEIQPGQAPDPAYALMTGTADPAAWTDGQKLLAKIILLREPGQNAERAKADELNLQLLRWVAPQDKALLMGRTVDWGFAPGSDKLLNVILGIDVYNASDTRPDQNRLQWTVPPQGTGWEASPQPVALPALATYHVDRFGAQAKLNLELLNAREHRPVELTFTNGYTNATSKLQLVLPAAASDRLGPGLNIKDGKLDDWDAADQVQAGPLVRMFDRPALQKQQLRLADKPAAIYTGWGDDKFYVAFRLAGAGGAESKSTRNFVDYQFRRAWGEDLCEILIQPIMDDNSMGPVLHVVCKPSAGHWVERKRDPKVYADPWQPLEGIPILYTARNEGEWTGELAIPWRAITDQEKVRPKMLRFNFVQHVHSTGQSASWAGPVDFGRDDSFMGLLYLRESTDPGMAKMPAPAE
ncbi:MAG TPA: hypothetical protein VER17_02940 [Tepidisphaeraceae bacterium]|nr:hypothetical protein [Tepidisphaeraceae bacterium]